VFAKRSPVNFSPHRSAEKRMTSEKIRLRFIFLYYGTIVRTAFLLYEQPTQFAPGEELCVVYIMYSAMRMMTVCSLGRHAARQTSRARGVSGSPSLAQNRFTQRQQTRRAQGIIRTLQFALNLSAQHNFMRGAIQSCERGLTFDELAGTRLSDTTK
jgi:hypothetical protein